MRCYFYGIIEGPNGLDTFVHRKRSKVPEGALEIQECQAENREEALAIANELRLAFLRGTKFRQGEIVIYADNHGQHTAIVLHSMEHESYFAFVTSNPRWGRVAREITKDEQSLMGYPDKGRTSYFTPVIRDNDMVVTTGKLYPMHRVRELIEEFDDGY